MCGCWSRAAIADLAQEALGADRRGQLRAEHLEATSRSCRRSWAQVDRRHAAPAELALEAVAAVEVGREAGDRIAQRVVRWGTLYDSAGR